MTIYSAPALLLLAILAAALPACTKDTTRALNCTPIPPHDGLVKCNGRFRHPTLGILYYRDYPRQFSTAGPNSLCYIPTLPDGSGNILNTSFSVQVSFNNTNTTVLVGNCMPNITAISSPAPNPNRYDSCTGTLYLNYNWLGNTREICDTCSF